VRTGVKSTVPRSNTRLLLLSKVAVRDLIGFEIQLCGEIQSQQRRDLRVADIGQDVPYRPVTGSQSTPIKRQRDGSFDGIHLAGFEQLDRADQARGRLDPQARDEPRHNFV
jgi:hypothetical protein